MFLLVAGVRGVFEALGTISDRCYQFVQSLLYAVVQVDVVGLGLIANDG